MKKLFAAVLLLTAISFWACQKEFSFETNTDTASTGAWEFKDSANTTYAGNTSEYYVDTTNATALMQYTGVTANQRGVLSIGINFSTRRVATGTYTSALGQVDFTYSFGNGNTYRAESSNQFSTENITVIISQITDTSVTGTFSGVALDSLNRTRTVKEGKFTYKKRSASTTPTPTASTGTLGTTTDTCTGAVVSGTYKKNVAMAGTNTVTVTANVTATGTYTIYSDTLKGIYFRGTGTFSTTGAQSVVIPAVGSPSDSGVVRFRIRYGSSNCSFQVKIDTGSATSSGVTVIPPTGDYFPTTTNSNWSYSDNDSGSTATTDTNYVVSTGITSTISGNSYNWFISKDATGRDTSYYRKVSSTGYYYTTFDLGDLTGSSNIVEINFLRDNIASGATWTETKSFTYNGFPATLNINSVILAKAVSATVGGVSSTDVIKVRSTFTVSALGATIPGVGFYLENWFARGGGIIYSKNRDLSSTSPASETKLRRLTIY